MVFIFVKVWGVGGHADGTFLGPEFGWSWHLVLVPSYVTLRTRLIRCLFLVYGH